MQTQDRTTNNLTDSIKSAQNYLFSLQYPDGYWWAELESNVTITAEAVLLHKIWSTDKTRPLHKAGKYLRSQQRENGSWELHYGDGGDLNSTVEAYMALRLLGAAKDDSDLIRAKEFILSRGGISKTRVFTKMHLALIGGYDWRGIPSIPSWVMLLPEGFPFTIYEMSSWARGSTVPLLIVFDRRPVYKFDGINFDELYTERIDAVKYELVRNNDWTDIFVFLDDTFKFAENLNLVPFRKEDYSCHVKLDAGIESLELSRQRSLCKKGFGGDRQFCDRNRRYLLRAALCISCLGYGVGNPCFGRIGYRPR
jgi:squalene-hopene/tetraprenyl-beta-curcumene cyclase